MPTLPFPRSAHRNYTALRKPTICPSSRNACNTPKRILRKQHSIHDYNGLLLDGAARLPIYDRGLFAAALRTSLCLTVLAALWVSLVWDVDTL
jgi:hypothetical protein